MRLEVLGEEAAAEINNIRHFLLVIFDLGVVQVSATYKDLFKCFNLIL